MTQLETLVRDNPLRERPRALLMLALYSTGRQADALTAYHQGRRVLVDDLGIEPGPELQALYGSILRQERSLVRVAPPTLDDHYDEVIRAFSAGRLVPVLGPGAGGVAGRELATLLAARFESRRRRARSRVRLAGRGGPQRRRAAPRCSPTLDARPRLRAVAPARLARELAAAAAPAQPAAAADRVHRLRHGRRESVRGRRRAARRGRLRRFRPRPRQVPPPVAGGEFVVVEQPNAYTGLALDERSVLLKIHGHVDRGATRELESSRSASTTTSTT